MGPFNGAACPQCGYDVGSGVGACPECGATFDASRIRAEAAVLRRRARWVLVLTLPAMVIMWRPTAAVSPPWWVTASSASRTESLWVEAAALAGLCCGTLLAWERAGGGTRRLIAVCLGLIAVETVMQQLNDQSGRPLGATSNVVQQHTISFFQWAAAGAYLASTMLMVLFARAVRAGESQRIRAWAGLSQGATIAGACVWALATLRLILVPTQTATARWDEVKTLGEFWEHMSTGSLLGGAVATLGILGWVALGVAALPGALRSAPDAPRPG